MKALLARADRERGAAIVEFALVAVLLFTLLIGMMEFGRMWFLQAQLAAGARDGARTMAVKNKTAEARDAVQLVFPDVDEDDIVVTPGDDACNAGGPATVIATYPAEFMTGFFDPLLGHTIDLEGKGVMRCGG